MFGSAPARRSAFVRLAASVAAVLIATMALVPSVTAAPRAVLGELFSSSG